MDNIYEAAVLILQSLSGKTERCLILTVILNRNII